MFQLSLFYTRLRRLSLALSFILLGTTGCLQTHSELAKGGASESQTSRKTQSAPKVASQNNSGRMHQMQRAQIDSRFYEIDRDFRELYGKIEVIERNMSPEGLGNKEKAELSEKGLKKIETLEVRIATLEEAVLALDKKLGKRSSQIPKNSIEKNGKPKGAYALGESFFKKGQYVEAIQSYDRYRQLFPRGRKYSKATFKMAESFRRLKLPKDAKPFYQEVIDRQPKTALSELAVKRLKSI